MRYNSIRKLDISNGEGCRVSVFTQGCNIKCPGCFNYQLWDSTRGKEWTEETTDLLLQLLSKDYIKGLTWLGGEPTLWATEITQINRIIKERLPEKTIWLYSGHEYEGLRKDPIMVELLSTCDVLVDGPYMEDERTNKIPFRGSKNQTIRDCKNDFKEISDNEYQ